MKNNKGVNIPIIQELWIVARNGLHIFSQKISDDKVSMENNKNHERIEKIDEDLFSGFVAAINSFTYTIGLEKCRILETKSLKLSFSHFPVLNLTFVGKSSRNVNNNKIYEYLEDIKSKFIHNYGKIVDKWSGSVSEFKGISKKIDINKDKKNWI
ncbi:MAG: hypothetical protein ACTSWX_03410 [Promethearchaeota archaeon]